MIIIALNIIAHLVLPLVLILWVSFSKTNARLFWYTIVGLCMSYLIIMSFAGAGWDWFGFFWPYIFLVLLVIVLAFSIMKRSFSSWFPKQKKSWLQFVITLAFFILLLTSLPSLLGGRKYPEDLVIDLEFPLKNGHFKVVHGGGNEIYNAHFVVPAQKYALDIVKINKYGLRAKGLLPKDPAAYEIFGAEVVSPCDGVVLEVKSDMLDQVPPHADAKNAAGNFIMIDCHSATVLLAHLKQNSVKVMRGDSVRANQMIAFAGNTGNTSEPHLHIHAVQGKKTAYIEILRDAKGIPIRFNKKFHIRGDIISN